MKVLRLLPPSTPRPTTPGTVVAPLACEGGQATRAACYRRQAAHAAHFRPRAAPLRRRHAYTLRPS